jgi:hypothetical protein
MKDYTVPRNPNNCLVGFIVSWSKELLLDLSSSSVSSSAWWSITNTLQQKEHQ